MKIPDELRAFIENRFERMMSNEEREEKEKGEHQRDKETRKKRLNRSLKKDNNELESAKQKGWISDNQYRIEKSGLLGKAEQTKSNYRKEDKEHIKPFGKTQYDRNSFICLQFSMPSIPAIHSRNSKVRK